MGKKKKQSMIFEIILWTTAYLLSFFFIFVLYKVTTTPIDQVVVHSDNEFELREFIRDNCGNNYNVRDRQGKITITCVQHERRRSTEE